MSMFERRLMFVLVVPIGCALILAGRLFHIQVTRGDYFSQKAEEALVSPKQFLPPLRGRIVDRSGRSLVSDEPALDLAVHYGVLSMDEGYCERIANHIRKTETSWGQATHAQLNSEVRRRVEKMWDVMARASGIPIAKLYERRDALKGSIEGLRRHIYNARKRQGFDESSDRLRLREEDLFHPVLRDISPEIRTRIELELGGMPFVRMEPSVRRRWDDSAQTLCHVLGNLGQVTSDRIRDDSARDDWLGCYRAGDEVGAAGIEYLAEDMLRGRRGFEEKFLDGTLKDAVPPVDGVDVPLTIDINLQQWIVQLLTQAVAENPPSTGASCVVLDVRTREILAMASVPFYSPAEFKKDYALLRDDTRRRPLLFRAVREEYQPGSIIKPVTLLAGFRNDLITPESSVVCTGSLVEGSANWHCWTHWKGMPGHGPVSAEEAIQHSCNIYFYTLGQRLNALRLTEFDRGFILGPNMQQGVARSTGLIEERTGIIPDRNWMAKHRKSGFTTADGRNYAIGQGEIQMTPMQAANMFATLASGVYRDPSIIRNEGRPRPSYAIAGVDDQAWRVVRHGLFRCVNEPGGTAYKYAHLDNIAICGKTGSAQCVSRIVKRRYTFKLADGKTATVVAPTIEAAREMLDLPVTATCIKKDAAERWPPPAPDKNEPATHAWFAGFAPYRNPKIAVAVIIEYGGGGGGTAGPVGRQIFQHLMETSQPDLSLIDSTAMASEGP